MLTDGQSLYDEECPQYEEDYLALPFTIFSLDPILFLASSNEAPPLFVEEVFAHRKKISSQSYKWIDIIAITDSKAKCELFKNYFSQKSPERIFRTYIRFYISFRDWVYPSQTIPIMLKKLKEQYDALSLIEELIGQGKLKITDIDDSPSFMYFLVTPDIFYEVLSHPGISFRHNDTETVTLAKDHYTEASAKAFRMLNKKSKR